MAVFSSDTIAAMATAPGHGGIAILRISGPDARKILLRLFKRAGAAFSSADRDVLQPRRMYFGHVCDREGDRLDDVLAVFMPGPHSATGEDVAEIHCHGGPAIIATLQEAACAAGARPAGHGEFTRRAFLNGKMDLTQAEAVAEIINASSLEGVRLAKAKLDGALGRSIASVRSALEELRVRITVAVDFPDEEAELLAEAAFPLRVGAAIEALEHLLAGYKRARMWREGALVVLAGCVNAGKSSLLNALLGRERSIVSPLPGTTRDYIEEGLNLEGLAVRVADTAGLRDGGDIIEEQGIRLTHDLADDAELIVLVVDACVGLGKEDTDFLGRHPDLVGQGRVIVAWNKTDAPDACAPGTVSGCVVCPVSARAGTGLEALASGIRQALVRETGALDGSGRQSDIAPNVRQSRLLEAARDELAALLKDCAARMPADVLGTRLDTAAALLEEVIGVQSGEDILDRIFADFCIGK